MSNYVATMQGDMFGVSFDASDDAEARVKAFKLAEDKGTELKELTTGVTPQTYRVVYKAQ